MKMYRPSRGDSLCDIKGVRAFKIFGAGMQNSGESDVTEGRAYLITRKCLALLLLLYVVSCTAGRRMIGAVMAQPTLNFG